jgi:thiosulfate reductase cytochrome b subunit/nitrate/TMAO reductase-like tetraheme cytochrome c subunit
MKKIYLYPIWLRLWHWFNALLFVVLIATGISMHFSDKNSYFLIPFDTSMLLHNITGILLSGIFVFYVISNIVTGNFKHYIPRYRGFFRRIFIQAGYYLSGIFNNEAHPFPASEEEKFNPLQQITYFTIMFFLMPIIIISGWFMLFPEYAPEEILGMGGVWPMAILHIAIGFLLSIFMIGHIYLGTTGKTVGELFKSMLNGWHLHDPGETRADEFALDFKTLFSRRRKLLPRIFYNPITMTGTAMAIVSFLLISALTVIEFFTETSGAYAGIITYLVFPVFLVLGILMIFFGVFRENRRLLAKKIDENALPIVDLNNPKHQMLALAFLSAGVILVIFTIFGSYKVYNYTESDTFCGEVCHDVMLPEYTAYKESPHAQVGCVKCHIGSGADWYVKSKLSGLYQVYATLTDIYPRPIPTPLNDLRPAEQTCEQCHWTKHFYNDIYFERDYFTTDTGNSHTKISMKIDIGGGNSNIGNNEGIHWQMNLLNEITYFAEDRERQVIPWVKARNTQTGKETIYFRRGTTIAPDNRDVSNTRKMDCIDCHNRPSHAYKNPSSVFNSLMAVGRIDTTLPNIKSIVNNAVEIVATSRATAESDIRKYVTNYYQTVYPSIAKSKADEIEQAVRQAGRVFMSNYFPEMKTNWRQFPNNIGHLYSSGCYRCHDGEHVTNDGKTLTMNCDKCHSIKTLQSPFGESEATGATGNFKHPGGMDKLSRIQACTNCHNPSAVRNFR